MIKGFIEVTDISKKNDKKVLVNIAQIEFVIDNYILIAFNVPNVNMQDYLYCKETYEEIKQKIKEAVE